MYEAHPSCHKYGRNKLMLESVTSHFSLILTWVLELFNQWKLITGQVRSLVQALLGLALRVTGTLAHSPRKRQVRPLNGVRIGAHLGVGLGEWRRWSDTRLVGLCAGIMHITLLLLPALRKWQLAFGLFISYCS